MPRSTPRTMRRIGDLGTLAAALARRRGFAAPLPAPELGLSPVFAIAALKSCRAPAGQAHAGTDRPSWQASSPCYAAALKKIIF
jgi:hypothetical protein